MTIPCRSFLSALREFTVDSQFISYGNEDCRIESSISSRENRGARRKAGCSMVRLQFAGMFRWAWFLVFWLLVIPVPFHAGAQRSNYRVIRDIRLGGEGNWDYVTVDADAKRVYVPRYGHIQVVDEVTGKLIGDIKNVPDSKGVAV